VTLSQAFHPEVNDHVSCSSSLTEEYYHLHHPSPTTNTYPSLPLPHEGTGLDGLQQQQPQQQQQQPRRRRIGIGRATSTISRESSSGSTLSSVTLSRALGRDVNRHEHELASGGGGFYVATRLGDFVQHEEDEEALPATTATAILCDLEQSKKEKSDTRDGIGTNDSNNHDTATQRNTTILESQNNQLLQHQNKYTALTTSNHEDDFEIETVLSDVSVAGSCKVDDDEDNDNDKKKINGVTTQITSAFEEISTDILTSIIPECGVPIPSVMAKVGGRPSRGYGMLLPWHSTRSIQNYHRSGSTSSSTRRVSKKRGENGGSSDSSLSSGRREAKIFSMSSVHTFRG
jgi:hypothetical protein